jgi:protease I
MHFFTHIYLYEVSILSKRGACRLTGKKALLIIAPNDFEDIEFLHTKEELEKAKIQIDVASTKKETATGMQGTRVEVDIALDQVNVQDYDAIVFIGGLGACPYYTDDKALSLATEAFHYGKIVCAVCVAPLILSKAGVLKGKHATVYDRKIKELTQMLTEEGAVYLEKQVVVDGNIITANGPDAAREFGRTIARELSKQKKK